MGQLRRGGRGYDDEFVAYYSARASHLRNTAYLLCGDWHLAEERRRYGAVWICTDAGLVDLQVPNDTGRSIPYPAPNLGCPQ